MSSDAEKDETTTQQPPAEEAGAGTGDGTSDEVMSKVRAFVINLMATCDLTEWTEKKVKKTIKKQFGKQASKQKSLIMTYIKEGIAKRQSSEAKEGQQEGDAPDGEKQEKSGSSKDKKRKKKRKKRLKRRGGGGSDSDSAPAGDKSSDTDDFMSESDDEPAPVQPRKLPQRSTRGKKRGRVEGQPRGRSSAYLFFSQSKRAEVRKEDPTLSMPQVSKKLGQLWQALSDEQKQPFQAQADADKERYEREWAAFERDHPEAAQEVRNRRKRGGGGSSGTGGARVKRRRRETGPMLGRSTGEEAGGEGGGGGGRGAPAKDQSEFAVWLRESGIEGKKASIAIRRRNRMDEDSIALDGEEHVLAKLFVMQMHQVADDDRAFYAQKKPALGRMKMLQQVQRVVAKRSMRVALMDESFLKAVTSWLTPMSDGALPSISIRTGLYEVLDRMPITADDLEHSDNLGKVLMAYIANPEETRENKRLVRQLIDKWCRELTQKTTDWRKLRQIEEEQARSFSARRRNILTKGQFPGAERKIAIPNRVVADYVARPVGSLREHEPVTRDTQQGSFAHRLADVQRSRGKAVRKRFSTVDVTGKALRRGR